MKVLQAGFAAAVLAMTATARPEPAPTAGPGLPQLGLSVAELPVHALPMLDLRAGTLPVNTPAAPASLATPTLLGPLAPSADVLARDPNAKSGSDLATAAPFVTSAMIGAPAAPADAGVGGAPVTSGLLPMLGLTPLGLQSLQLSALSLPLLDLGVVATAPAAAPSAAAAPAAGIVDYRVIDPARAAGGPAQRDQPGERGAASGPVVPPAAPAR